MNKTQNNIKTLKNPQHKNKFRRRLKGVNSIKRIKSIQRQYKNAKQTQLREINKIVGLQYLTVDLQYTNDKEKETTRQA